MEKELDKLIERLKLTIKQGTELRNAFKDLAGPELSKAISVFEALVKNGVDTKKAMSDAAAAGRDFGDSLGYAYGEAVGLYQQLKDIAAELDNTLDPLKKVQKSFNKMCTLNSTMKLNFTSRVFFIRLKKTLLAT